MGPVDPHALVVLGALLVAGGIVATAARRLQFPGLTGYVAVGLTAAAIGGAVLTPRTVSLLQLVEQIAGAAVLFGIGSRLALGSLRPRLRSIAWLVGSTLSAGVALAAVVLWASSSGAFGEAHHGISLADAAMLGLVLVAASPTVIAFVSHDEGADGPSTRMTLAASALLDATIVLLVMALAAFGPGTAPAAIAHPASSMPLIAHLAVALAAGGAVGALLAMSPRPPALIVAAIGAGYVALAGIGAHDRLALMAAALAAGVVYANAPKASRSRPAVAPGSDPAARDRTLDRLALSVLFVTAGALTEVQLLASVVPLALLLVVARAVAVFAGASAAGWLARDRELRTLGFPSFLPQAGFSLLLIGALSQPSAVWHALLLLVVLVNEIVMPPFFRRALERSGEARVAEARVELR